MKSWQTIVALVAVVGSALGSYIFIDDKYQSVKAAETQTEALQLIIVQTASDIQQDISSIRLQQLQWELDDIIARAEAEKSLAGDASRLIVLEARIKKLVSK